MAIFSFKFAAESAINENARGIVWGQVSLPPTLDGWRLSCHTIPRFLAGSVTQGVNRETESAINVIAHPKYLAQAQNAEKSTLITFFPFRAMSVPRETGDFKGVTHGIFPLDIHKPLKHNICMNRLDSDTRAKVISCLIEGSSIRATVRITGVAKKTVMRLLLEVGEVCAAYQDQVFHNLKCRRLQLDELWSWIYCKDKNRTAEIAAKNPAAGDIWLWVAVDADTKLVPAWWLGDRTLRTAKRFVSDLAKRLSNRVQITTDGHRAYIEAIENSFGSEVDYATLQKIYGLPTEWETRYSPAQCIGCETKRISGDPAQEHVSTSFVERQNWTVRTNMRRYTRLSNGFSRKVENHAAAVALNYFAYNFIKIHRTLRMSPAMAAGVTDRLWEVSDLVALWEEHERRAERAA